MIYLDNTTQSQQVYIPRQVIQTATTREINIITSGDVINIVDEKLESYYTSAETDTQIENAIGIESARCEETYAKIEDIPDVSEFVTSADVKTQVEEYNYVNSADVKTQIEDYHYITSGDLPDVSDFITSGQAQEQINQSLDGYATEQWVEDKHYLTEHQSLSAYSTTEQMNSAISAATDDMATKTWVGEQGYLTEHQSLSAYSTTEQVEGMIANESARTEETYAKKSDIPDLDDYYTSAQTNTAIENAVAAESARCESTYAKPADIPDVSNFITSADAKTQIDEAIAIESARCESTYLKEHQSLAGLFDSVNYVSSAKTIVFYDKENTQVGVVDATDFIKDGMVDNVYISGETLYIVFNTDAGKETIELDLTQIFDANNYYNKEDIDNKHFVNSGEVKTQIEGYNYVNSGDVKTQIEDYHYITSASLPDVSDFVTSADVETQINEKNYITSADVKTQVEEYNYVNSGQVKSQIEGYNYITAADLPDVSEFITSADAKTQIDEAIGAESARCEETYAKTTDIPSVDDFVTSAQVETQITDKNYVNSGQVKTQIEDYHYITSSDLPDVSDFVTSADVKTQVEAYNYVNSGDVKTQIDNNLTAYTPTSGFATINGSGITDGGNLVIQGGGGSSYTAGDGIDITNDVISVTGRQETLVSGTNIKTINNESILGSGNITIQGGGGSSNIELTQQEYIALTAYQQDALYIISDAEEVDLNNFATSGDIQTLSGQIQTISGAVDNKADKVSTTANSSYYRFPAWNAQGIITGYTSQAYQASFNINGGSRTIYSTSSTAMPTIFAPTTAGGAGQPLLSNGSGAPVWASFKFWFGTETQYNAITTKDSSTIYFVKPD